MMRRTELVLTGLRASRRAAVLTLAVVLLAGCGDAAVGPSQDSTQPTGASASPSASEPAASDGSTSTAPPSGLIQVPGSHVALVPPAGWEGATSFTGFQHTESGSSILVMELPGPFAEVSAGLTAEGLATKGIALTDRSELAIGDHQAIMLEGTQSAAAGKYGRFILVVGTSNLTALVNGAWPEGDEALRDDVEASLRTVVFSPEGSTGASDGLTFDIDPVAPLTRAGTMGNGLLLNTSGKLPSADPSEPAMIVAPSLGSPAVGDLETFARQRLEQLPKLANMTFTSAAPVTIDGRTGVELTATATRSDDGRAISIYGVMLGGDQDYVLMVGQVDAKDADAFIDVFRATAETFRQKR